MHLNIKTLILLGILFPFNTLAITIHNNSTQESDIILNLKIHSLTGPKKDEYVKHKITAGRIAIKSNEFVTAMENFTEALRLATAIKDSTNIGLAYSFISLTNAKVNNNTEALQSAIIADSFLSSSHNPRITAWNKVCVGSAYLINGNNNIAQKELEQVIKLKDLAAGITEEYIIYGCENLAKIKMLKGNYTEAVELLKAAIEYNLNPSYSTRGCYYKLGLCYVALGNISEAHKYFDIAYNEAKRCSDKNMLTKIYLKKASFFKKRGDFEVSTHYYSLADSISQDVIDYRVSQDVQQVALKYQKDIEAKQKELQNQQAEIETLQLHEKSNRLKTTIAILTCIVTLTLSLMMYLKRRASYKMMELQDKIAKTNEQLLLNYIAGQEQERNRIARDLHDGIGSQLAVLKMKLSQLSQSNQREETLADNRNALTLCDEIYNGLRNVAYNLTPRTLDRQGLVPALNELTYKLEKNSNIAFCFNNFGVLSRYHNDVELAIFRVCQEITANIIKHSKATEANIDIAIDNKGLGLTISWDGPGFDPQTLENSKGFGWKNILTRLNQVNGSITIDSAPSKVFSMIIIEIPIKFEHQYGKAS